MTIDEAFWESLPVGQHDGSGMVGRRVREDSERNLFLGVTIPEGHRVLALAVAPSVADELGGLPETRSLRTVVAPGRTPDLRDVRVVLVAPEMARVFTPFVEDVLEAVAPTASDEDAVEALVARIGYWRNLLSAAGSEGLSRSDQQGLFGELWCLRHVFLDAIGPASVASWTGPDWDDRDFQFRDLGFEVKTTILDNPPTVDITSERQLDSSAYSRMFLLALALEALPAGTGETLNELVDELLAAIDDDALRFAFRDKLIQYGYLDLHRPAYETTRYTIRQFWRFELAEGFPRITEHTVPEGVGRIRYRLSLDACKDWRVDDGTLSDALGTAMSQ